jgi:hypothetical protein
VKAVRYMPKIHGRCPLPKSMTPTVRTSPEIKKECHLGEPEAESSIRIANVWVMDMISVTSVRVRSSCTCRATGHIGDAAALGVTPSPTVLVAARSARPRHASCPCSR